MVTGGSDERQVRLSRLESTGRDLSNVNASEAVVFWLAAKPASFPSGWGAVFDVPPPNWRDLSVQTRVVPGPIEVPDFAPFVDHDGDQWPEYVFWDPDYGNELFRLQHGRIVAWNSTPDEATGIRKGHTLDEQGELTSFDLLEDAP